MKRFLFVFALLGSAAGAVGGWYWYKTRPEAFPYADQVPANAAVYIAIPDLSATLDEINRHPVWKKTLPMEGLLSRVKKNRAHLAGPAAIFATLENNRLTWTTLVRLKNGTTHIEGPPYQGTDSLQQELTPFLDQDLRPRVIVNFAVLPPIIRDVWGDFSLAILEPDFSEKSLEISGAFLYRRGTYRDILENRVNAPPVIDPGEAPLAVSGLANIDNLWALFRLNPSIPEYDRSVLGPAWGVQFRSPEDLAFWFELSDEPVSLDGVTWKDFKTRVEDSRWIGFTRTPAKPGSPSEYHEIIRLRIPEGMDVFRGRYGDRGEPLLEWLERFSHVESRLTYGGDHASVSVTLTLP